MNTKIRAIFFDLDGTLVDTEPLKFVAHHDVLESHGGRLNPDDYTKVIGQSHDLVRSHFLKMNRIEMPSDDYDRLWEKRYIEQVRLATQAYPDGIEFLQQTKNKRLKCVLVTSSDRTSMEAVLETTGLKQYFDATVSADDVQNHKPDPEPYEHALQLLELLPSEAIVVEDSPTGYASAIAAKIPVVIHRHKANQQDLFPLAIREFENFSEIIDLLL